MSASHCWLFDTDIQIHRALGDPNVRAAADERRNSLAPVAIAAYTKLEFKGAYIQNLILLARKVRDSSSIEQVFHRVLATGGRDAGRMIAQLARHIELDLTASWSVVQGQLLTYLDSQTFLAWKAVSEGVDVVFDPICCTRASEAPVVVNNSWQATIPRCTTKNTKCCIAAFFASHKDQLAQLLRHLCGIDILTEELQRIRTALEAIQSSGRFDSKVTSCRQIGDLIIGLHTLSCKGLLSSNRREHGVLSAGLGYHYQEFPISSLRMK